ncbi:MAG: hypothetical protein ACI4JQ_02105 [Ruminococcus sp.]
MEAIEALIEEIKSEIELCKHEIEKCRRQREAIVEREHCYDDRKTMLLGLLEIAERSAMDRGDNDEHT